MTYSIVSGVDVVGTFGVTTFFLGRTCGHSSFIYSFTGSTVVISSTSEKYNFIFLRLIIIIIITYAKQPIMYFYLSCQGNAFVILTFQFSLPNVRINKRITFNILFTIPCMHDIVTNCVIINYYQLLLNTFGKIANFF